MSFVTGRPVMVDGRPALRFERRLPHSPARVWRAVTAPEELAQWFVAPMPWTPAVGDAWEVGGVTGAVVEVDAPRRIAWTHGAERYSFDITPHGDGSLLVFVHVITATMPRAQTAAGWETYLDRLAAALTGTPLAEREAHGGIAVRIEAQSAAQAIAPEPGRRFVAGLAFRDVTLEDGPQLRLERLLPASVERVWEMLTRPADLAHWFPGGADALAVERAQAPTVLDALWHGERLRFEVQPHAVGCRLIFVHAFDGREFAARTAAGWDRCFARFEAWLAGVDLTERASLELWPVVHERYAERFGVDPEVGRAAFAAHPLT